MLRVCDAIFKYNLERSDIKMKKTGEPIAAVCAVVTMVALRFAIRRMVKRYSGVKL